MGRGQGQAAHATAAGTGLRATGCPSEPFAAPEVSEELVLVELAAFLIDFDHWPTRQEFLDSGQSQLYQRMQQTGGGGRWAPEFGFAYVAEQQDPEEERLRAQLGDFLAGFDHWPTSREFGAARRTTLYQRVLKHGGAKRWAAEFGLPTHAERRESLIAQRRSQAASRRRAPSTPRQWSTEVVRAELAAFLDGAEHFPSENEFRHAGQSGLYRAVLRFGGSEHWAAEFGLPRVSDIGRRRTQALRDAQATAADARQALREQKIRQLVELCANREYFPSHNDWIAAGREDLREFVHRNGGVHVWAERVGLPLRPAQDRRPYGMEQALADGRKMLAQHGRIPGGGVLRQAGLNKLYLFIRREFNGDRDAFAELCR